MDPLVHAFKFAGGRFAEALRRLLPLILNGTSEQQAAARVELQKAAELASAGMSDGAREFLRSSLAKAVVQGQRRAALDIKTEFGGVNRRLVEALAVQFAGPLGRAVGSPRQFLAYALRQTSAYALDIQAQAISTKGGTLVPTDAAINRSLAQSVLSKATSRETSKKLLSDLGLTRGDSVIFLSGRRLGAQDYARLVTRTRLAEAEHLAQAQEYKDQGVEYIITSEHEVEDPRDICAVLQGTIWALGPNDRGIPQLPTEYGIQGFPPWHPNCMHTYKAWIPALNGGYRVLTGAARKHEAIARKLDAWDGATRKAA